MSWWMVVVANWLTWCQGCLREEFLAGCCSSCILQSSVVKNKLDGYADDSTLVAVVPSPGERVAVSESMNRDLNRISVCCNLWGMKLNASKTKTMIVSRSCTVYPQLTPLSLDGTVLKESADLVILGVTFDAKMTFEMTFFIP